MCVMWRASGTQVTTASVSSPTRCRVGYIGGRVFDTGGCCTRHDEANRRFDVVNTGVSLFIWIASYHANPLELGYFFTLFVKQSAI